MKTTTKLWIGIGLLTFLVPLGLFLPEYFKSGAAWGEWGVDELKNMVGYAPKGLAKLSSLWNAPLPDYAFKGCEQKGIIHLSFAYIVSAVVGIGIIVAITMVIGRIMTGKENGKEK